MSRLCCIATCPNVKQNSDQSVTYHPFPLDAQLRATWIEFIGGTPARFQWRSKYVCSAHFLPSDLDEQAGLAEGAVPTIFASVDMEENDCELLLEELDAPKPPSQPAIEQALRDQFCRLCLRKQPNRALMKLSSKLQNTPLVEVIRLVAGIKITPSEQLPNSICGACLEKIDCSYNIYLEFKKYSGTVERIVQDKQLDSHYKYYDEDSYEAAFDANEAYLNNLMQKFTQEEEGIVLIGSGSPEPQQNPNVALPAAGGSSTVPAKPAVYVYSWKELLEPKKKEFKCSFCPKEFQYVRPYRHHMFRHQNIKPHQCPYCDKRFVETSSLNTHVRTHTGELPFPCRHGCGEKFPRYKARDVHERRAHPNATPIPKGPKRGGYHIVQRIEPTSSDIEIL